MTQTAMAPLGTDIHTRYAASFYAGTVPAQSIIELATESAKRVFRAEYANLSPVSGSLSLLAVVFAMTNPGDSVGRIPPFFPGGGYPLNYGVFDRVSLPLPFNADTWQVDLEPCIELLLKEKPKLVVLGSSIVTYPMPVTEIADVVHSYGGVVPTMGPTHSDSLRVASTRTRFARVLTFSWAPPTRPSLDPRAALSSPTATSWLSRSMKFPTSLPSMAQL